MLPLLPSCLLLLAATHVGASPINSTEGSLWTRQSLESLTPADIAVFRPYTFYAATASCEPSTTRTWTCGGTCDANPSFIPIASGGNGATVQYWFVGWDPTLQTVIVSHQGTDADKVIPVLTNANIILAPLSSTLFPGVPSNVRVHAGFKESQADTAAVVLQHVQAAIDTYGARRVTVVGNSLGSAISLLDAVYLPLHLPSSVSVVYIGFGTPRVGNPEFADYVDAMLGSVTRITNRDDPVPILPGRFLGYKHVSGELHIIESGEWKVCPGQDNTNVQCSTGDVANIFEGNEDYHGGPYGDVRMGCRPNAQSSTAGLNETSVLDETTTVDETAS